MSKVNTYWVEFEWSYLVRYEQEYEEDNDYESKRFYCLKKDILREATLYVKSLLKDLDYKNLKIKINDFYITTECEL